MVVGGIAEMFMVSKKSETVYLKKRKNFTKIAVEVGAKATHARQVTIL